MISKQSCWEGQECNPHQLQTVQPKEPGTHTVQVMDEFMMRDPSDWADQEAYHVDREMRGQRPHCADHPSTIDIRPDVLQVDIENEQRNCEGDDTIAERFNSTLGHRWLP